MSTPAYDQKLNRLGRLVEGLGLERAGALTMLASSPDYATAPPVNAEEREFLKLMRETLQDVQDDRRRFNPHS